MKMKSKEITIYSLGEWFDNRVAIPCKQVKDIEEARKIVLAAHRKWQDTYTDEEYLKKFGKAKVVITKEFKSFIRYKGMWEECGYEYKEADFIHFWDTTTKGGRGAIECYCFCCDDAFREWDIYERENMLRKEE